MPLRDAGVREVRAGHLPHDPDVVMRARRHAVEAEGAVEVARFLRNEQVESASRTTRPADQTVAGGAGLAPSADRSPTTVREETVDVAIWYCPTGQT